MEFSVSRWRTRSVVLAVFALTILLAGGLASWTYLGQYFHYRESVESLAEMGYAVEPSLREFLVYRRALSMSETVDRLEERRATADEVREALGEPDSVMVREERGEASWFYSGPILHGRRQPTFVLRFDLETSRLVSVGNIVHD